MQERRGGLAGARSKCGGPNEGWQRPRGAHRQQRCVGEHQDRNWAHTYDDDDDDDGGGGGDDDDDDDDAAAAADDDDDDDDDVDDDF